MPIITVKLAKGRSVQQKQLLTEVITREAATILDVDQNWVTVLFEEYERSNWATGGELHALKYGEGHGKQGT